MKQDMKNLLRVIVGCLLGMGVSILAINLWDFRPETYGGVLCCVIGFILFVIIEFKKEGERK